jgi:uncharacterized protein YoxC
MESNSWLIILSICFFIMTLTFVAVIVFILFAAVELRKASVALREFLIHTEEQMQPIVELSEVALKSLRRVSDDAKAVTGNVRSVSDAVAEFGETIRSANAMIHELQQGISCRASGVRAGIGTALAVFLSQFKTGR